MNIFIAANDKYILPAKVMLLSFLINNDKEYHYIYFMYSSVKEENIHTLRDLIGEYQAKFIPIQVNADDFKGFSRTSRLPLEAYYRFLVTKYLPETEKRALWLDVDIVVNASLNSFYYQSFDGYYLAGCRDIGDHTDKLKKLGCPENSSYINSGVLLFDAEKMRQYQLVDYYTYYLDHEKDIIWFDQDVINGKFGGKIKVWDCDVFNVQVSNWRFKNQYNLDQAAIIHYIGESKPWYKTYTNAAARMWDQYYAKTFDCGKLYLISRSIHRQLQKWVWIPFRDFREKIYEKCTLLRYIRNAVRKTK